VCFFDNFCLTTQRIVPSPKLHEMVTINYIDGDWIGFEEYNQEDMWEARNFRKLDYQFAENLLAELTQSAKSEYQLN